MDKENHGVKIIARNYAEIKHLRGSKMIDDRDSLIGEMQEDWLIGRRRMPSTDLVIVTEKVDGANVGVLRLGDKLHAVSRKGYDVLTSPYEWLQEFDYFVGNNRERFMNLLNEGERICGEWLVKTHTLRYKLKSEPFLVFDIISGSERASYFEIVKRAREQGFTTAGLIHAGEAIPPEIALKLMGKGYHGVIGDEPEGVVYRYETSGKFQFSAKFVSNPLVGNEELFKANMNSNLRNNYKKAK
ncbi:MAG: RNA ligase family protein [Oscillospiraceae bacterium]|jgi:hypothetical protein|nr:RNA ligase family protein [Oscillospiraceae bacterium]